MTTTYTLAELGWKASFQQQLTLDELEQCQLARISEQHRSEYWLLSEQGALRLSITPNLPKLCVGDWLLLDQHGAFVRELDRQSLFQRRAAGELAQAQLIAANVDTLFIVCSLNQNFNLNRIERYLSLAHDAEVEPVVVLSKRDLCEDAETLIQQVRKLDPMLMVEAVNGLDQASCEPLLAWCHTGQTIAFLGSSGVGKSTLVNQLMGSEQNLTGEIRQQDGKGRHTTTARSLRLTQTGAMLLDTPGMRELQLADCEQGVQSTFAEIAELAKRCRFNDCQHQAEPGCAVQAAIQAEELEPRRLLNYQKLLREQAHNAASIAERRADDRALGKLYRSVLSTNPKRNQGSY